VQVLCEDIDCVTDLKQRGLIARVAQSPNSLPALWLCDGILAVQPYFTATQAFSTFNFGFVFFGGLGEVYRQQFDDAWRLSGGHPIPEQWDKQGSSQNSSRGIQQLLLSPTPKRFAYDLRHCRHWGEGLDDKVLFSYLRSAKETVYLYLKTLPDDRLWAVLAQLLQDKIKVHLIFDEEKLIYTALPDQENLIIRQLKRKDFKETIHHSWAVVDQSKVFIHLDGWPLYVSSKHLGADLKSFFEFYLTQSTPYEFKTWLKKLFVSDKSSLKNPLAKLLGSRLSLETLVRWWKSKV
jgi:hypothetical protein